MGGEGVTKLATLYKPQKPTPGLNSVNDTINYLAHYKTHTYFFYSHNELTHNFIINNTNIYTVIVTNCNKHYEKYSKF